MANRVNNWQELLKLANKNLKKYKIEISASLIDADGTYDVLIDNNGITETYASGYYEDELGDLINDAWSHALTRLTHNVEKLVAAYFKLSDAEKDEFLRMTGNQ